MPTKPPARTKSLAKASGETDLPTGEQGSGETDPTKAAGSGGADPPAPPPAGAPGTSAPDLAPADNGEAAGAGETAPGPREGGRKRGGESADAIAIPAKVLRTEEAAPGEFRLPELPPDDSTADAWEVLKDYIPWVKQELAKSAVVRGIEPARPLWQYAPLGLTVCDKVTLTQSYMAP